jgi:hypothetical protein
LRFVSCTVTATVAGVTAELTAAGATINPRASAVADRMGRARLGRDMNTSGK